MSSTPRKPYFDSRVREGLRGLIPRMEPLDVAQWEAARWCADMVDWYDAKQRQRQDGAAVDSTAAAPCGEEGRKPLPSRGGTETRQHESEGNT
jgi:hypothetical protein